MVSRLESRPLRKAPEQRRAEIVTAAARIALEEGLERVTLRAVAARLGVRPGLITHYFPTVEALVAASFSRAVSVEHERLFLREGTPFERVAQMIAVMQSEASLPLARLWLNARHLCRFSELIAEQLEAQESYGREALTALIAEGMRTGEFGCDDALAACVRIFMAIDGFGTYANNKEPFFEPAYAHFASDVSEWALGLAPGALLGR